MYDYLFELADTERAGVLKGAAAVPFLSKSGLDRLTLKQVRCGHAAAVSAATVLSLYCYCRHR